MSPKNHPPADYAYEFDSPFLTEELFAPESEEEWEARASTLASESPFLSALEPGGGSFDSPETEGPRSFDEGRFLEGEEPGVINNTRRRVTPTVDAPLRWICKVEVKDWHSGKPLEPGTGVLISNRHILTAAHVVYAAAQNMQKFSIEVTPALDKGVKPFETRLVSAKPRLPANYKPGAADQTDWDYALLKLDTAIGEKTFSALKGNPLCYWGSRQCGANTVFAAPDPATLNRKSMLIAGYPTGKGGGLEMWCATGVLIGAAAQKRTMQTTADMTKGQSGSPVWVVENKLHCLVGIAVAVAPRGLNVVLRLTPDLFRQLKDWIKADGETLSMRELRETLEAPDIVLSLPEEEHAESPFTGWSPEPSAEEAEDFADADYEEDELALLHEQPVEERDDQPAVPKDVADALAQKDWPLALKLSIQAGQRDENELTNLVFFARHPELPREKLDPKHPKIKQLSAEWAKILNKEVWDAIKASAENTDLVVSGKEVADHQRFFRGKSGKRLKQLVGDAAREVDINPGLLGTIMMAETRSPQSYLSGGKVSSYLIGVDDFYEARNAIRARVPAYAKIKWDKKQQPDVHDNDAQKNPRKVKTIMFDSGPDAVLATAVYVKFYETLLREAAAKLKGDFDALPMATRLALTRMAMAAGIGGVTPRLKEALAGKDIFVRKAIPVKIYQTQRNATVRTAQAMHLSDWVFGIPVPAAVAPQPELETFEGLDEEEFGRDEFGDGESEDDAVASYQVMAAELDEQGWRPEYEAQGDGGPGETWGDFEGVTSSDDPYPSGVELEEEFRLNRLPETVQQHFRKGGDSWLAAVREAISAGSRNPSELADLIFFMQHPERMVNGSGKPLNQTDSAFVLLRAEWGHYQTIASRLLGQPACSVFLPAREGPDYGDYVTAQTTGRITLMVNGRDWRGASTERDETKAFDMMQDTVQSLGRGDYILLANWQFIPTTVPLTTTGPAGVTNWGELFQHKAKDGVKIRIIISQLALADWMSDVTPLNKLISELPTSVRDNWKYIVSKHPAGPAASHHQKFMVARKGGSAVAYCGGLDISRNRTPFRMDGDVKNKSWSTGFVWHDVHAKLEGRIVQHLEREFVRRWNRERGYSVTKGLAGWKGFEKLTLPPVASVDREPGKNTHKLQMLRTVRNQDQNIKRDDIWQGYFRLIGCATRYIFMENQYFREPKLADAIVKQAQAQSDLIVIIVVSSVTDDKDDLFNRHCIAFQFEFFQRLSKGLAKDRLGLYTLPHPMIHSKVILVDDHALSVGSANANPRGFFLDSELNVMLDDPEAVRSFRHSLWAHDLGVPQTRVEAWAVSDFKARWDDVAKANDLLKATPANMTGEGIVPFDFTLAPGRKLPGGIGGNLC